MNELDYINGRITFNDVVVYYTDNVCSKYEQTGGVTSDLVLTAINEFLQKCNTMIEDLTQGKDALRSRNEFVNCSMITDIEPYSIAKIVCNNNVLLNIDLVENGSIEDSVLYIYSEDEGIYLQDTAVIDAKIRDVSATIKLNKLKEVYSILKLLVPIKKRTTDIDLVCVNNGVFNYKTKVLIDHTPDYVFIAKSYVDYKNSVDNPIIKMPNGEHWDVESWFNSLSDDEEIVNLLWQTASAVIRPNVNFDKAIFLFSTIGANGKGTFLSLLRSLTGGRSHVSIPLDKLSDDFGLSELIHASCILTDENDVGVYIDKAANMKSIITKDAITVNRKFKDPLTYIFKGLMVQCLNEFPRFKDKSNSIARRQIYVPMEKKFEGIAVKEIKSEYLKRQDVLEYVLHKALNSNFYEFDIPQSCADILEEQQILNDPILAFVTDIFDNETDIDIETSTAIPSNILYSEYKDWFNQNNPSGSIPSSRVFGKDIKEYMLKRGCKYTVLTLSAITRMHNSSGYTPLQKRVNGYVLPQ